MNKTNDNLIRSIKRLNLLINRHIDGELTSFGLAREQFQTLYLIHKSDIVTQKDLLHVMQVEPATLTGIIDGLVKKGLLVRAENITDKRSRLLRITGSGKKLIEEVPSIQKLIERRLMKHMIEHDKILMNQYINIMIQNLDDK